MRCCPNCFKDDFARELVAALAAPASGKCDLCSNECEKALEIAPESELAEQFFDLLSVFVVEEDERASYATLFEAFCATWNVFESVSEDAFNNMLMHMFPKDSKIQKLLASRVRLDPSPDPADPCALGFFGAKDWIEFSQEIKHTHRYHAKIANEEVLMRLLGALETRINPETGTWFRARIWNKQKDNPSIGELKEPAPIEAGEGRMNPRGVAYLYVSNSTKGAMAEVRASRHDKVAVMEMAPRRSIRILDLSRIDKISPFDEDVNCRELASNLDNLRQIKDALVKPMRSSDDSIEYIPTQYIADFAKSIGFEGIGYDSVLYEEDGIPAYNVASFQGFDEAYECRGIVLYKINDIEISPDRLETIR